MPTRRAKMRDVREVMRMYREGCQAVREIARHVGSGPFDGAGHDRAF
jgi:hypothetical protein